MACFEVIFWHMSGETDENQDNFSQGSRCPVRDLDPKTNEVLGFRSWMLGGMYEDRFASYINIYIYIKPKQIKFKLRIYNSSLSYNV
jgi:hypothetical protein